MFIEVSLAHSHHGIHLFEVHPMKIDQVCANDKNRKTLCSFIILDYLCTRIIEYKARQTNGNIFEIV
jgi:hypothetical protein